MKKLSIVLAIILAFSPGCLRKTLSVRTEPPGAEIYIDGVEVGQSPVTNIPFSFYGNREIMAVHPDYAVQKKLAHIRTPWYAHFPLDIFTELILPFNFEDNRYFVMELKRAPKIEPAELVARAEEEKIKAEEAIKARRAEFGYKQRAYVEEGKEKPSILWGPFFAPPRIEPLYELPKEPEKKDSSSGAQ